MIACARARACARSCDFLVWMLAEVILVVVVRCKGDEEGETPEDGDGGGDEFRCGEDGGDVAERDRVCEHCRPCNVSVSELVSSHASNCFVCSGRSVE